MDTLLLNASEEGEETDKKIPVSGACMKYFPPENEANTTCHFRTQQNKTGPNITEYYNMESVIYSRF
jgi:hypothetical protein